MCAYQIGEHLHLTFADHLDLYSQQANPNFRFPSEQIPLFSENTLFNERRENLSLKKIFPLLVYKENRAVFPFCRNIW
jgi:hypothetical protein